MEDNKNMTAERSLEIIRESISRSQCAIAKNMSIPLIWWGVVVMAFAVLIAYLWKNHGGPVWNVLWFAVWLVGYVGNVLIDRKREVVPVTFVSKIVGQTWIAFGIFASMAGVISCLQGFGLLPLPEFLNTTSVIVLLLGMAATLMGFVIGNRVVCICGIVSGVCGAFAALQIPGSAQLFVVAGAALLSLVVPGVLIYIQNKG